MMIINSALTSLQKKIRHAESLYGHAPGSIKLVAVTKQQSVEKIKMAISAGQFAFAENYLQEALPKITSLTNYPLEWHFIGRIQKNKTRKIATYFDWVHSLDNAQIAIRLNNQRPNNFPPLNICIEVNDSMDIHKAGIKLTELSTLLDVLRDLPHLRLRGLMTMVTADFSKVARYFHKLRQDGLALDTLSMGTSQDYNQAIYAGSNLLRIGTEIFGVRNL